MSYNNNEIVSFQAATDLTKYARVKIKNTATKTPEVEVAGAADIAIGYVNSEDCYAGDNVAIRLSSSPGIIMGLASEAFVRGAHLYAAASGKLTDTDAGGQTVVAIALNAATADGDYVEVIAV